MSDKVKTEHHGGEDTVDRALSVWFANTHRGWRAAMKAVIEEVSRG